jgi:hypothetical protein
MSESERVKGTSGTHALDHQIAEALEAVHELAGTPACLCFEMSGVGWAATGAGLRGFGSTVGRALRNLHLKLAEKSAKRALKSAP